MPQPYKALMRFITAWIVLCILVLLYGALTVTHHGLTRTVIGMPGYEPSVAWPWPYFDGADYTYNDFLGGAHGVHFEGVVWQGKEGQTIWRIIHSQSVIVRIDGEIVYQVNDDIPIIKQEFPVTWSGRWLRIEIDYPHGPRPATGENRDEMGIYERTPWGTWRLLPNWRLYSDTPDSHFMPITSFSLCRTAENIICSGTPSMDWIVCWLSNLANCLDVV